MGKGLLSLVVNIAVVRHMVNCSVGETLADKHMKTRQTSWEKGNLTLLHARISQNTCMETTLDCVLPSWFVLS